MNLRKSIKIILLVLLMTIFIIMGIIIKYSNKAKIVSGNELKIYTPLEKYSLSMSSVKGFPFEIKCNNKSVVISISSGKLLDANDVSLNHHGNFEYEIACNQKIYWNPINDDVHDNKIIDINIKLLDKNSEEKKFKLKRNEKNEYYLFDNY